MNKLVGVACAFGLLASAAAAAAEQWVDYRPEPGVWGITDVRVDPNRIDDYLVALKRTWIPQRERAKRNGLIDVYRVEVKESAGSPGPNVRLVVHYPSYSKLEPNEALERRMEQEYRATVLSKAQEGPEMAARAQYRTIVDEGLWTTMRFAP